MSDSAHETPIRAAKIHDLRSDAVDTGEGRVILVDRLWPRGVAKDSVALDGWFKDVAPSPELREWFGHDPAKFDGFTARYRRELDESDADELGELVRAAAAATVAKPLFLAYAAKDREHNHAFVLAEWLRGEIG